MDAFLDWIELDWSLGLVLVLVPITALAIVKTWSMRKRQQRRAERRQRRRDRRDWQRGESSE